MRTHNRIPALLIGVTVLGLVSTVSADITDIRGATEVWLTQYSNGVTQQVLHDLDVLPTTEPAFPVQSTAVMVEPDLTAAAAAGAQLSDPYIQTGTNPEDFALTVVLDSLSATVAHETSARAEEIRTILIDPASYPGSREGDHVTLNGRFYLDGVMAIFADEGVIDLSNVDATLHVMVDITYNDETNKIMYGGLEVTGNESGDVSIQTIDSFPRLGIFRADLAGIDNQLSKFDAFAFPMLAIDYQYQAPIGVSYELRAEVKIDAANRPDGTGVAVLIGTPFQTLADIVQDTQGADTGKEIVKAMERERANPTGTAAFPDAVVSDRLFTLLPACGLIGFETVAGLIVMGMLGVGRITGRRSPQ